MLPGKKYAPEDYLQVVWARKWFVVIPTVVIGTAVAIYTHFLPDEYRSSAVVLVVGQQVPKDLVRPTVTDSVEERLRAITAETLSRTKLERIIEEFDLYKKERKSGRIMEDIVDQMRSRDLRVDIATPRCRGDDASQFTVSFTAEKPRTAMAVAERLASLFVSANEANRELQAGSTSQFLDAQLEEARRSMKDVEDKVAVFRAQHSGRLPEQMAPNIQMLQTTQAQIQANADAASKERDHLTVLEGLATELEAAAVGTAAVTGPVGANAPAAQQLAAARKQLRDLQVRLKDDHPDVRAMKRTISELETKAEAEALAVPVTSDGAPPLAISRGDAERLSSTRAQIKELRAGLERRKKDDERLKTLLASYSARLESMPGVDAAFTDMMRDYTTQREHYESLLKRRDESKLAENLERRQIGEQFKVIDAARLPEKPIRPDRQRTNLMGILGGLAFGLGLIALLEYRDTTLKTDEDVVMSLSLPVLAVIPAMTNVVERAQHRRRTRFAIIAASAASVLLVAAAVAWKYRIIQDWVR